MSILRRPINIATLIGTCSINDDADVWYRYGQIFAQIFLNVVLIVLNWFSAAEALYQLENGEFIPCLFAVLHIIPLVLANGSYISLIYQMKKNNKIFTEIQEIFNQCKCN